MSKLIDLTGKRFGRLTVIKKAGSWNKKVHWLCKCDCGKGIAVVSGALKSGNTSSCGCLHDEVMNKLKLEHTQGYKGTRVYNIWIAMKQRCYDKNQPCYCNYGGRGITVCDEWLGKNGAKNFCMWAAANGYSDDLTIDRIDVNGDYEPNNCRWTTRAEQANNTRRTHYITYNGETMSMKKIAEKYSIDYSLLSSRLKRGWDIYRAIETPKIVR